MARSIPTSSGVYAISARGRVYIGQAQNLKKRWGVHKAHLSSGVHHCVVMQRIYDKYGISEFSHTVLEECDTVSLDERETFWMKRHAGKLMNCCTVGGHSRGYAMPESAKRTISRIQTRVGACPKERKRRSERAKKQHAQGNFGQAAWTAETREAIRQKALARGKPVFTPAVSQRIVAMYEKGISQYKIAKQLKCSQSGVGKVLRRHYGTPEGEPLMRADFIKLRRYNGT